MGAAASSVSSQMQAEHNPNATFPWWVRFLAKGVALLGGFLSLFFGVLGLITLSATCMVAILLQMTFGALIIALEAPFCCQFIDFIGKISRFSETRQLWHKAAIYGAMGLIPILLCIELNTILGSGTIFASGVIYGFMSLGKKADRSNMMAAGDPAWSPQVNQSNIP